MQRMYATRAFGALNASRSRIQRHTFASPPFMNVVYRSLASSPSTSSSSPSTSSSSSSTSKTEPVSSSSSDGGSSGNGGGSKNTGGKWSGPVSWATVGLLAAAGGGVVVYNNVMREKKRAESSSKVETYGKPLLGGPWSLVRGDTGAPITSGDLLGSYVLVYFGFTFCPDICPNELVKMGKVTSMLEERLPKQPIVPIFVTLDPYRDSCGQVDSYVRDFHPRMLGLTGTPTQVARMAKKFRVYFQEVDHVEEDDDYLVDHSIVMYLMSPTGEFEDFYTQLMTATEIADKIEKTMKKAGK